MTDKLPDNGGYVAAAYLVFLALLLIYVAVMAVRAGRLERDVAATLELLDREGGAPPPGNASAIEQPAAARSEP